MFTKSLALLAALHFGPLSGAPAFATSLPQPAASHLKYLGYWGGGGQNLNAVADYVNLAMIDPRDKPSMDSARKLGLKVVLVFPQPSVNVSYLRQWLENKDPIIPEWVAAAKLYMDVAVGIFVADESVEPDLNRWQEDLESIAKVLTKELPALPLWLNFTWVVALPEFHALPAGYQWISFDAYGPFENAGGGNSIPRIVDMWEKKLAPDQQLILIPTAWQHPPDLTLSEDELVAQAEQYYDLAAKDSRIIGLTPFTGGATWEATRPGSAPWTCRSCRRNTPRSENGSPREARPSVPLSAG